MADNRIRALCYIITRAELERFLVERAGLPEDSVVTHIGGHPGNQEAWLVTVQSAEFRAVRSNLDMIETVCQLDLVSDEDTALLQRRSWKETL